MILTNFLLKIPYLYYMSIRRHLDYTSARLRRAVKVSSLLSTDLIDLKTEKTAVFALTRLRKHRRFSFFGYLFKAFRLLLHAKMRHVPLCTDASLSQLSLYELTLSFCFFSLLSIIFYISFPINHVIPKHVLRHKIQIRPHHIVITQLFTNL